MNRAIDILEQRGWQLRLVEVSSYAAKTAREQWGFDVTTSKIEEFDCPPHTVDLSNSVM